jgi:hypothetical protein
MWQINWEPFGNKSSLSSRDIIPEFLCGSEENHEEPQLGYPCPGRDSNRIRHEYKSRALSLRQPVRSGNTNDNIQVTGVPSALILTVWMFPSFPYTNIHVLQPLINCIIFRGVVFVIPADVSHFVFCTWLSAPWREFALHIVTVENSWWRSVYLCSTRKWFLVRAEECILIWNIKTLSAVFEILQHPCRL